MHIQGSLIIDHSYILNSIMPDKVKLTQKPIYYTDHDRLQAQYSQ